MRSLVRAITRVASISPASRAIPIASVVPRAHPRVIVGPHLGYGLWCTCANESMVGVHGVQQTTRRHMSATTETKVEVKGVPAQTKAVRVPRHGDVSVLTVESVDIAPLKPTEILIQVAYAGLNFIDTYLRSGLYPGAVPFTLGREAAGIVVAVGENVRDYRVGSRVVALAPATYAEYAVVDPTKTQVAEVPAAIPLKDAATIWLQGLTAHAFTTSTYPIKAGDTVLIHAGAGGAGGLFIQMAKLRGATVITTVSNEEKAAIAKAAGADHVILYSKVDFHAAVMELTGGKGVHAVYDSVGKDTWEKSLKSLRPLGMLILFGNASGPVPPIDPLALTRGGSLFLTRPTVGNYVDTPETLQPRARDLWTWMAAGQLKLRVAKEFPLAAIRDATTYLEGRSALGKVILVINDSLDATHTAAAPVTKA